MSKINKSNNRACKNVYYIKFYPCIKSVIGCEKAALILERMEYWFKRYEFGFYKFVEPCSHPLYRIGDSWSEEFGVSRKVFNRAFDVIGIRYKSKTDFLRAEDKFKGKLYASYHDRVTNKTYYVRNHAFATQFFEDLFKKKSSPRKAEKTNKIQENIPQNESQKSHLSDLSKGRSRNGPFGHSYTRVSSFFHKKTSSLSSKSSTPSTLDFLQQSTASAAESEINSFTEGMIKIWNEEIGELGIEIITKGFLTRLYDVFKTFFEQSLESWKSYCQMISSSKFLMGEAQNKFFKKAWITWAIKEETINRIRGGGFVLGDRQTNQDKEMERLNCEINSVENKKNIIEEKIKCIKEEEIKKRKSIIKERITALSEEEKMDFEQEFEIFLEKENNSLTEEFRKLRWKGAFISAYFNDFIKEKIANKLFKRSLEEDQHEALQSSRLLEVREKVCENLTQLRQKKNEPLSQISGISKHEDSKIEGAHEQPYFTRGSHLQPVVG